MKTSVLWLTWLFGILPFTAMSLGCLVLAFWALTTGDTTMALPYFLLSVLLAVLPALFLYHHRKNLSKGRYKYLFIADPDAARRRKEAVIADAKSEDDRKKEEEEKEAKSYLDAELARTKMEEYSAAKIGGWAYLPALSWVVYALIAAVQFYTSETYNGWLLLIFAVMAAVTTFLFSEEEGWDKSLKAKAEAEYKKEDFKFGPDNYVYEHFYTDSKFIYSLYMAAKIICYLANFAVIGMLGILGIAIIGNISIAPTTIIIILLIIIILNQNRAR